MRSKSARTEKTSQNPKSAAAILAHADQYHENPFLKLLKGTKKEKQDAKSATFQRLIVASNLSGISKSALRRRKRKAREQLKPQMNDLLTSIADEVPKGNHETPQYVESTKPHSNAPNSAKRSGRNAIMRQEHSAFNQVLQNPEFRSSPFAALKSAIANNMKSSGQ